MTDQDPTDTQWTDQARERFRAEAAALAQAVLQHSEVLLAMNGRQAEFPALFSAGDVLGRASVAYADAQFDYTGTFPPLGLPDNDDDEDEEDDEELADDEDIPETAAKLHVLHRADYRITDPDAVMQAGRRAYRELWPDDTDEDAEFDVSHLGRALYQVQHAGGVAAFDVTSGMQAAGATTWIIEATELLDEQGPDDWPADPFALGEDAQERLLHRIDEVWG